MKIHTYKYIKNKIEITGYKLLSKEYKNANSKLKLECPKGHQYEVTYDHFHRGQRCSVCIGNKKLTYEYVKQQFEKEGYKLLSKTYKNVHNKLSVECPKRHQFEIEYSNFQQGRRCPVCWCEIRGDKKRLTHEFVRVQYKNAGYELKSKYKDAHVKDLVECPEGHQYEVIYNNFQQGKRCPVCWELKSHSQSEKDCLNVVEQILPNEIIIENDRTQIINPKTGYNLELDIYIPSLNKAIEFNGEYWHSYDNRKFKDNQKQIQCKEKGIDLLIIWYQDWVDNKEEQIEKLKQFLNNKNVKI